jgi:hypothetical protein
MDRARTVVCSLLPALWVLTAGQCLASPVFARGVRFYRVLVVVADARGSVPSIDLRSGDASARLQKRRVSASTGGDDGGPTKAVVPAGRFDEPAREILSLAASADRAGLARCWQFVLRASGEPRAPSFLS